MQRNNSSSNGVQPACAACRHQRKKCGHECMLAPYFPADRNREFQAVHKVFGVSNVSKLVRNVKVEDRQKVADSLAWEAFCRQKDPVLGPYGEYKRLYEELKLYRNQGLMQLQNQNHHQLLQQLTGQPLVEWGSHGADNNGNGIIMNNNKGLVGIEGGLVENINNGLIYNNNHDHNGNTIVDLDAYCYSPHFVQSPKKLKQEREVGSVAIPLQQHSINGFNQQYYNVSGQFG